MLWVWLKDLRKTLAPQQRPTQVSLLCSISVGFFWSYCTSNISIEQDRSNHSSRAGTSTCAYPSTGWQRQTVLQGSQESLFQSLSDYVLSSHFCVVLPQPTMFWTGNAGRHVVWGRLWWKIPDFPTEQFALVVQGKLFLCRAVSTLCTADIEKVSCSIIPWMFIGTMMHIGSEIPLLKCYTCSMCLTPS